MQHRHLRKHAVPCFRNYNAAGSIEDLVRDDHAAPHRQAVHEPTVGRGAVEPAFVDTPVDQRLTKFLVFLALAYAYLAVQRFVLDIRGLPFATMSFIITLLLLVELLMLWLVGMTALASRQVNQ